MRKLCVTLLLILVALAGSPAFAQGQTGANGPVLDNALNTSGPANERLKVIVKYRRGTSARVRSQLQGKVDRIKREHRGIGALTVDVRRSRLSEICSQEGVS